MAVESSNKPRTGGGTAAGAKLYYRAMKAAALAAADKARDGNRFGAT